MSKDLCGFVPQIYYIFNQFWLIQTIICFSYCIKAKKLFPNTSNLRRPAILQFNLVLLTNFILYITEICYTSFVVLSFNSFLQQNIRCAFYLIPYLIHGIYWYYEAQHYFLLFVYNISLLLTPVIITCFSYSTLTVSLKIPFIRFCPLQFNMFTYFYDDDLNLQNVENLHLMRSVILSSLSSLPLYIYLFNIDKIKRFFKSIRIFTILESESWIGKIWNSRNRKNNDRLAIT